MTNRLCNNDYYSNKIYSIIENSKNAKDIINNLYDMFNNEYIVNYNVTFDYTHDKANAFISVQWETRKNDVGVCISPINIDFMKEVDK